MYQAIRYSSLIKESLTELFCFLFFVDELQQKGMRHDFDVRERTQAIFRHFQNARKTFSGIFLSGFFSRKSARLFLTQVLFIRNLKDRTISRISSRVICRRQRFF
jgi:hypothetical protein